MSQSNEPSSFTKYASESEVRQAMLIDERKRLTGIGGWLAAFVIMYGFGWFFGIGLFIGMGMHGSDVPLTIFAVLDWVGRTAVLAGLLSASGSGSKTIRAGQGVQVACAAIQFIIILTRPYSLEPELLLLMLGLLGYQIAWMVYFRNSRRVRHTYDDRAAGRHSEVF